MKATLTLNAPLLKDGFDLNKIGAAIARSAAELERDIKENIQKSVPAGRTYRRGAIIRASSKKRSGLKLKTRNGKLIVGFNFHRASRSGQAPAIDTGRLINSVRSLKVSQLRGRVIVGVEYGDKLDRPDGLNRPFFRSRVELYRPRYFENIRNAVLS